MAKINVLGQAVVITSGMKLEALKKLKKYRPDALVLKGGDDGKEPVFRIGVTSDDAGSINEYSAVFGGETHDDAKLATITLAIPEGVEDVRNFVAETIGRHVLNLIKLEETLPSALAEVDAEKAKILENIVVM